MKISTEKREFSIFPEITELISGNIDAKLIFWPPFVTFSVGSLRKKEKARHI